MSNSIKITELLGGPLDGGKAFWVDPVKDVQDFQYTLPTGSTRWARYRIVRGKIQEQQFMVYVDNDLGRADALKLIADKFIQIESIG